MKTLALLKVKGYFISRLVDMKRLPKKAFVNLKNHRLKIFVLN